MEGEDNHDQVEMNVDEEVRFIEVEELISIFKSVADIYKLLIKHCEDYEHNIC